MKASHRTHEWAGFRSVLCPVDFSEPSRHALRYAEAVALRGMSTLTVTYANDPLLIAAAAAALHNRGLAERSARELEAVVKDTLQPGSATQLRVRTRVSVGDPAVEILKTASRLRSDLIVMGTQGLSGAGRLLVGSTTLNVLRRTTRPVLAVPARVRTIDDLENREWPGAQIVAAVDLERDAAHEVADAALVANWFGSSLLLVHVVTRLTMPAWFEGDVSAYDRPRIADAERRLHRLATIANRDVKTSTRVICGRIAERIQTLASAEHSGLVMTALRDKHGWFGAGRGSVSYELLTQAATPVLAFPPRWRPR